MNGSMRIIKKRIIKIRINLMLIAVLFILSVSGCGKVENTEEAGEITPVAFQPAGAIIEGRKNVYVILKNADNSYWKVVIKGVAAASEDFDVNVYYGASKTESEWQAQRMLIEEAMEKGDAIVLAPDSSSELASTVTAAYNKGKPVVLVDTTINCEDYDVCYMTDNLYAGQKAAKEMLDNLKDMKVSEDEEISIAIQVGSKKSQTINERLAGFCEYWAIHAPKNWKIVEEVACNEGDVEEAKRIAEKFLDEDASIKGVFGCNNGSTVGFASVVKEKGRTDVCVVGFDFSDEMASLINDSNYHAATMLQCQYDMGYQGVKTALAIINGEKIANKFVDTGVVVVNGSTINTPEIQEIVNR